MKEPEHRPGPEFEKARNETAAWRAQQIAALTAEQKRVYLNASRQAEAAVNAKTKELADRRQADIRARTQELLRDKPRPQLTPPGRAPSMSAIHARRETERLVGGAPLPRDIDQRTMQQAERQARGDVARAHDKALKDLRHEKRQELDKMLRGFERARQTRGDSRQEFARAGARDRARSSFERAGRDDPSSAARKAEHSPALAKAIEKARAQEQAKVARNKGLEMEEGRNRK